MELVVITTYMANGGAQRVLSVLIKEWEKMGHSITIIQTQPSKFPDFLYDFPKNLKIINYPDYRQNIFYGVLNVLPLVKYLKKHPQAVVIAFLNPCINLAAICSKFVSNIFVFSERNDPTRYPLQKAKRIIRDNLFKCADACVFQTTDAKLHFPQKVQSKGVVIPNPVNNNLPDINRKNESKHIVAFGRLSKQKNFPMLIYAFKKLNEIYSDFELDIYGNDDGEKNSLHELIKNLKLENSVHLKGFTNNVFDIMNECVMYVSTSDYEGISNSMLEALAMGVPSICTDCPVGGAREMITNDENGILIPVGDIEALFKAMKKIIEDKKFAEKIGQNAFKIRTQFSADWIATLWIKTIEEAQQRLISEKTGSNTKSNIS